jgi:ribosomal protein L37AE/L43A
MFMLIDKNRCPSCGTKGTAWKENKGVFICPKCSSFFNEFGFVMEPRNNEEVAFS